MVGYSDAAGFNSNEKATMIFGQDYTFIGPSAKKESSL